MGILLPVLIVQLANSRLRVPSVGEHTVFTSGNYKSPTLPSTFLRHQRFPSHATVSGLQNQHQHWVTSGKDVRRQTQLMFPNKRITTAQVRRRNMLLPLEYRRIQQPLSNKVFNRHPLMGKFSSVESSPTIVLTEQPSVDVLPLKQPLLHRRLVGQSPFQKSSLTPFLSQKTLNVQHSRMKTLPKPSLFEFGLTKHHSIEKKVPSKQSSMQRPLLKQSPRGKTPSEQPSNRKNVLKQVLLTKIPPTQVALKKIKKKTHKQKKQSEKELLQRILKKYSIGNMLGQKRAIRKQTSKNTSLKQTSIQKSLKRNPSQPLLEPTKRRTLLKQPSMEKTALEQPTVQKGLLEKSLFQLNSEIHSTEIQHKPEEKSSLKRTKLARETEISLTGKKRTNINWKSILDLKNIILMESLIDALSALNNLTKTQAKTNRKIVGSSSKFTDGAEFQLSGKGTSNGKSSASPMVMTSQTSGDHSPGPRPDFSTGNGPKPKLGNRHKHNVNSLLNTQEIQIALNTKNGYTNRDHISKNLSENIRTTMEDLQLPRNSENIKETAVTTNFSSPNFGTFDQHNNVTNITANHVLSQEFNETSHYQVKDKGYTATKLVLSEDDERGNKLNISNILTEKNTTDTKIGHKPVVDADTIGTDDKSTTLWYVNTYADNMEQLPTMDNANNQYESQLNTGHVKNDSNSSKENSKFQKANDEQKPSADILIRTHLSSTTITPLINLAVDDTVPDLSSKTYNTHEMSNTVSPEENSRVRPVFQIEHINGSHDNVLENTVSTAMITTKYIEIPKMYETTTASDISSYMTLSSMVSGKENNSVLENKDEAGTEQSLSRPDTVVKQNIQYNLTSVSSQRESEDQQSSDSFVFTKTTPSVSLRKRKDIKRFASRSHQQFIKSLDLFSSEPKMTEIQHSRGRVSPGHRKFSDIRNQTQNSFLPVDHQNNRPAKVRTVLNIKQNERQKRPWGFSRNSPQLPSSWDTTNHYRQSNSVYSLGPFEKTRPYEYKPKSVFERRKSPSPSQFQPKLHEPVQSGQWHKTKDAVPQTSDFVRRQRPTMSYYNSLNIISRKTALPSSTNTQNKMLPFVPEENKTQIPKNHYSRDWVMGNAENRQISYWRNSEFTRRAGPYSATTETVWRRRNGNIHNDREQQNLFRHQIVRATSEYLPAPSENNKQYYSNENYQFNREDNNFQHVYPQQSTDYNTNNNNQRPSWGVGEHTNQNMQNVNDQNGVSIRNNPAEDEKQQGNPSGNLSSEEKV